MCEKRIEKVTLGDGVSKAKCSKETKKLKVVFDDAKTSVNKIEFELATFGHDTPHHISTNEVYNKLPDCCKYDRKADLKAGKNGHQH